MSVLRKKSSALSISRNTSRRLNCAAFVLALLAALTSTDTKADATAEELDWVPRDQLNDEQLANCPNACAGAYVAPESLRNSSDQDPKTSELQADADSITIDQITRAITASGDVNLSNGWRQFRADEANIDQDAGTYNISGNIQLREPGLLILGESATVDRNSDHIELSNGELVLYEERTHVKAESISRVDEGEIFIDNATYTTCEPNSEAWSLVASSIEIDQESDVVVARDMRIEIKGVPIFYAPYLTYPLSDARKTGLLYPEFSNSSGDGYDFSQPVYFNLAENYDLTVTPRWIESHGFLFGAEGRYMSDSSLTTLSGAYLSSDEALSEGSQEFRNQKRWFSRVDHKGIWAENWITRIDFSKASDSAYLEEIGDNAVASNDNSHLNQIASIRFVNEYIDANLQTQRYQSVSSFPAPYEQLPRIELSGSFPAVLGAELHGSYNFSRFDRTTSTPLSGDPSYQVGLDNEYVSGNRQRVDVGLSFDQEWAWGFVDPEIKVQHLRYNLDNPLLIGDGKTTPSATVPSASIKAGLFFERESASGLINTLEPIVRYSFSDATDQSNLPIFDTTLRTKNFEAILDGNRFAGLDRIDDSHQISIGVSSRFVDSRDGSEPARFSLAQTYYFKDRNTHIDPFLQAGLISQTYSETDPRSIQSAIARDTLQGLNQSRSALVGETALNISDNWSASAGAVYQTDQNQLERMQLGLRYRSPGNGALANFSYHLSQGTTLYREVDDQPTLNADELYSNEVEQVDISALVPISEQWTVIARWNQDLTNSRNLELFGGVRYESCCWNATFVWRRWLDRNDSVLIPENDLTNDSGIFFSFQLKGLAGVGDSLDAILGTSVDGYQPPRTY